MLSYSLLSSHYKSENDRISFLHLPSVDVKICFLSCAYLILSTDGSIGLSLNQNNSGKNCSYSRDAQDKMRG